MRNCIFKPEEICEKLSQIQPHTDSRFNQLNDMSDAALFAEVFGGVARYNVTARAWYVYDGIAWARDEENLMVAQLMKLLQKGLVVYANEYLNPLVKEDEALFNHIFSLGRKGKRDTIIADARDFKFITNKDLDQQPYLFNCQNCVLDLQNMKVLKHSPDLMLSKVANVHYEKGAVSTEFVKFMNEVMFGDQKKIRYLQKLIGYSLTADTSEEACYILYGKTTRNGKSTLVETIAHMMGGTDGYAFTIQPETLASKDKNSRNASGDVARLEGCRFLNVPEPPKRMNLNVELLKNWTGHDTVTARNLYEREREFLPVFKLFMNTNYLPLVTDETFFSSDRVRVITFDRHFTPAEQDRGLKARLQSSENLSGILNWCIEGLKLYYAEGLEPPESVVRATEEYRETSDKVGQFIQEALEESTGHESLKDVYAAYVDWCRDSGLGVDSKRNFKEDLKSRGLFGSSATIFGRTVRNVVMNHRVRSDFYTDVRT